MRGFFVRPLSLCVCWWIPKSPHVSTNGSKLFRMKYRFNGKEKTLSLGAYPDVSLRLARDRRDDARKLLAQGST
ncbi:MAG: Arm DNA-binding domain-containing protein [Azoarcus sp.]|nr:Arm DNA-binding domain-containing protein [Azoarcus sp.]